MLFIVYNNRGSVEGKLEICHICVYADIFFQFYKSHHLDSDYDSSVTHQKFFLNCEGALGDMIFITDRNIESGKYGHGISEVRVFGSG